MAYNNTGEFASFGIKYQHLITPCIDLAGGTIGGATSVFIGQPLDTVKVKMQTFPHLYKNSLMCVRETILKEKFRGLYSGTAPALVANCAENAVLFGAYGICQNIVNIFTKKDSIIELNSFENASAGFIAAFFSAIALCPTELIKCRLQAMREMSSGQVSSSQGPWKLTKGILKKEGVSGLFRGFGMTAAREMPGYFFFFGGNDLAKTLLTPKGKTKDEIGLIKTAVSGGFGGIVFWLTVFPFDVLKSRLQVMDAIPSSILFAKELVQKEGFSALYKGLGPTLVRTFPATGALFVAYEYSKTFFHFIAVCPKYEKKN